LPDLKIVPAGIYYSDKETFRSRALIYFGEAIPVSVVRSMRGSGGAPTASGPALSGEPPADEVHALTDRIEQALASLTLQADSHAALEIVALAEDIFTADDEQPLAEELELRRRFITGYHGLRERDPARLARLESEIRRFAAELGRAGLEVHELVPRRDAGTMARVVLLFPVAGAGAMIHFIPYRIVDHLARRFSGGASELTATVKFLGGLALYPLTWLLIAAAVWKSMGPMAAAAALTGVPLTGLAALIVMEDLDDAVGRLRAIRHRMFSGDSHAALVVQRRGIRREIAALETDLGMA
jgi:hypothetical protein